MDIKMKDRHGNTVTGATGTAVDYFDASVEAFGIYRGDPVASLDAAIAKAPEFVAAHLAQAMLLGLTTEPAWREAATMVLGMPHAMSLIVTTVAPSTLGIE
jgi:hypothetical protein